MRAGTGSGSLAERFSLPALRSRIPLRGARWCPQGLSVHQLPTSSFADYRNGIAVHQIAIDDLVSGDLPDQPSQDGTVDLGIETPSGRELPNCLVDSAQADARPSPTETTTKWCNFDWLSKYCVILIY